MKCHVWIALSTPDSSTACWLRWGGLSVVLPIRYNSSSWYVKLEKWLQSRWYRRFIVGY